ncbi:MAG: FAD/NAD(P)-binding protein [Pseudomonadota bacterium]
MTHIPHQNHIAIVGAGLSGTSIVAHHIRIIQKEWQEAGCPLDFPVSKITVIDPQDKPGCGGPYQFYSPDDIALLNQPAYAMSPFPEEPNDFSRWLNTKFSNNLDNSFQPRRIYGEYLQDVFQNAVAQTGQDHFPAEIEVIQGYADDASFGADNLWHIRAGQQDITADKVVVADGHYQNEYLSGLRGHPLYFDSHLNRTAFQSVPNTHGVIAIIGSGQTMVDRFAELQHYGYTGSIITISRRGILPWEFKPEIYRDDSGRAPYTLQVFTKEAILKAQTFEDLNALWEEEISIAQNAGYGPGHVLGAYFSNSELRTLDHPNLKIWDQQKEIIKAWYANPTSPQRFRLLKDSIERGQFQHRASSISADHIIEIRDGFEIQLDSGGAVKCDAVFNAAGCARTLKNPTTGHVRSPLIRSLDEQGHIKWDNIQLGVIGAGQQIAPGLFYAGPYSYPSRWGCETFRDNHEKIAKESLFYRQLERIPA